MKSTTGRPRAEVTFLVLAAGVVSFAMLQSLITPVLSTIQVRLHTTQNTVTWVLTANLLSAAIFTPILGRVGDAVGKKRTLVVVLAALAVGCLLAAVATNIGVLIVARVIQGAAGAVFPLSFGIIRDEFPAARVASAVGTMSAIIAAGGGLGIVLAGPIVDVIGYGWLFWVPMIVVTLAALAAYLVIPESPARYPGRVNWLAAALLSAGLVCLLLAVSKAPSWGWTSTRVIGLLTTTAVVLAAWIIAELRSAHPLVDMRMMRRPAVWTTNLAALLFGAGWFAIFAFLPQFVQTPTSAGYGFGSTVTEAGLLMLPMVGTMFGAGILSGRVERTFSSKAQLATGAAFSVLACTALALAHDQRWQIAAAAAVFGAGAGLAFSSATNLIVTSVPAGQTGVASGMNANFRTIGGSIGAALMGSIVTATPQSTGLPREAGYTNGFLLLAGISIAAIAAALVVPSVRRAAHTTADQPARDPGSSRPAPQTAQASASR
jgi:predicted MFS family arabinose efflux permease